jgi:hypothetical protein
MTHDRRLACLRALTLALAACSPAPSQPTTGPALKIEPADATCSADADCGMTMTQCSCDCGSPVNVARKQKYVEAEERACKSYEGPMCKMACNDTVICDSGVCTIKK